MFPDVSLQVIALSIRLGTIGTLKRAFLGMNSHVYLEVIGPIESLVADGTEMRILVCVVSFVYV